MRHRAILHNTYGAALAVQVFGEEINGVPTTLIAEQHLKEDTRKQPTIEDWLGKLELKHWMKRGQRMTAEDHAQRSVERFGGQVSDFLELHSFFDEPRAYWDDHRSRAILHNAYGIFLAVQVFGPVINVTGKKYGLPTRYVAESHIMAEFRFLPTIENWLDELPREQWMSYNAAVLSQHYTDNEEDDAS